MLIESELVKIRVAVPADHAEKIREVLGRAGAGVQGEYSHATGSIRQIGRWKAGINSKPAIGGSGEFAQAEEELIETLCHKDLVEAVIVEVIKAHPYEEPAIDIIPRLDIKND